MRYVIWKLRCRLLLLLAGNDAVMLNVKINTGTGVRVTSQDDPPRNWPWHRVWWKPSTRRRNLVKAGALILAEIERLDRAAILKGDA